MVSLELEADFHLLKHILHDWNDEEAVQILQRCRQAMRPGGWVIVIEMLLGEVGEPALVPIYGPQHDRDDDRSRAHPGRVWRVVERGETSLLQEHSDPIADRAGDRVLAIRGAEK